MNNLFLELTLLISFVVIVYMMSAAVPRIEEEKDQEEGAARRSSLPLDRLDQTLMKARDKFLRRARVLVMKVDNLISKKLKSKDE